MRMSRRWALAAMVLGFLARPTPGQLSFTVYFNDGTQVTRFARVISIGRSVGPIRDRAGGRRF